MVSYPSINRDGKNLNNFTLPVDIVIIIDNLREAHEMLHKRVNRKYLTWYKQWDNKRNNKFGTLMNYNHYNKILKEVRTYKYHGHEIKYTGCCEQWVWNGSAIYRWVSSDKFMTYASCL